MRRRRRGSRREDPVYKRDIYSYSIYPKVSVDREENHVKLGRVYKVRIIDVDDKGRGIAIVGDVRIIVPQATVGDLVKVKISRVKGLYAQGEVVEWVGRAR